MTIREEDSRNKQLIEVAAAMMTAARTAPKACGIDYLEIATVTGDDIKRLAAAMRTIGEKSDRGFFLRDADNVEASEAVVLIGTRNMVRGLDCGLCGYPTCGDLTTKAPKTPCAFAINDLGIALGSAVSVAADHRVDNRIMYSAGVAAEELEMLPDCRAIFAIPLSATGKSVYFDRKSAAPAAQAPK